MRLHRPPGQVVAAVTITWTLVWFAIGWFALNQTSHVLPYSLMIIGLTLGYGVRAVLKSRVLVYNLIIVLQLCLIVVAGHLAHDTLFAIALVFTLLGELYFSLGVTPITVRVSVAAALALGLLQLSFDGALSVVVAAAVVAAPLPLVAGVAFAFIEQEREQHALQARISALEMAHLADVIRTQERVRLARELHDTLAQGVVGITLQLETASAYLAQDKPERAQSIVQGATQRARTTLHEARQAIANLRSTEDVNTRITEEIERFQAATEIPCQLDVCHLDEQYPHLNEVVQHAIAEGLMNIARHAHAAAVTIRVAPQQHSLHITIHDNGVGFDPHAIPASGHYGLQGLGERISMVGGQLTISCQRDEGTTLHISLPREG